MRRRLVVFKGWQTRVVHLWSGRLRVTVTVTHGWRGE